VRDLRSKSAQALMEKYNSSELELVEVGDIVTDQVALEQAIKGVDAVAHTASP
jgi:ERCC4-type nuclease